MKKKPMYAWVIWFLFVIGALNWGLIGAFDFNLVTTLFGTGMITKVIYILVGLAALAKIYWTFKKMGKKKR
jgi:uncharacterized protein